MKALLVTLFCCVSFALIGQEVYTLKIIESPSGRTVENASVNVLGSDSINISNAKGFVQVSANLGDSIKISHPDLKTAFVTAQNLKVFQIKVDRKINLLEYKHGIELFYTQLKGLIRYPVDAIRNGQSGLIMVYFSIDQNGNMIVDEEVKNKKTKLLEKEAFKALSKIGGTWSVDYKNTVFSLPIEFNLRHKKTPRYDDIFLPKGYLMDQIDVTGYKMTTIRTIKTN
ncbi:energy transducer TonB [Ekhidna sp.]|uniref:energy transducer TonB n=1 Tax=Ekhidna sp. TaxID=2608089 RepID=UPI003BABD5BA